MVELTVLKNIVMISLIRVFIHHPNMMRSKSFLKVMQIFPQKISASYDARMKNAEGSYHDVLVQGFQLIDSNPKLILDLGTGTGITAFAAATVFPEARILGIDQSEKMIVHATKKRDQADIGRISFIQGNACDLASDKQSFDLVVSTNAPIYLDEACRVLRTRGCLMVAFSFAGAAFTRAEADIRNLLKSHGLVLSLLKREGKNVIIIGKKHDSLPNQETNTFNLDKNTYQHQ